MSKYTTELRHIVNSNYDLGLQDYPIFDEEYRSILNDKIIKHYFFHEIGFETVEQFKFYLNNKMREIMDYYNQMYKSELLELNPLLSFERVKTENMDKNKVESSDNVASIDNETTNLTNSTENQNNESNQFTDLETNSSSNSNRNSKEKNVDSDTPTDLILDGDIESDVYATNAGVIDGKETINDNENLNTDEVVEKTDTIDKTSSSETSSTNVTNSETSTDKNVDENYTTTITENGFEIPVTDLLLKYRETFLNVDMMIIKELRELFMLVY